MPRCSSIMAGVTAVWLQMAAELERERARVEAEVLATAQLVTGLETRLRECQAAQSTAEAAAAAAQQAVHKASPCHAQLPLELHGFRVYNDLTQNGPSWAQ